MIFNNDHNIKIFKNIFNINTNEKYIYDYVKNNLIFYIDFETI